MPLVLTLVGLVAAVVWVLRTGRRDPAAMRLVGLATLAAVVLVVVGRS